MKKFLFMIVAAVCILASCSKDARDDPEQFPAVALNKAYPVHAPVIVYSPAADGDDTDELLAVLNTAEPGSMVKLTEGDYHVGYIELYGFNGSIVGAGKDKTIIFPAGQIEVMPQVEQNIVPAWWRIIGGSVNISNLTLNTGNGTLLSDLDPYYGKVLAAGITVNSHNPLYFPDNPPGMTFNLNNVNIICGSLDSQEGVYGTKYNVLISMWIGMDVYLPEEEISFTSGEFNISNCYFKNALTGLEVYSFGGNAVLNFDKNRTEGCADGFYGAGNFNSCFSFTNNTFKNSLWNDILIEDNDFGVFKNTTPFRRCKYVITGNAFTSPGIQNLLIRDVWSVVYPEKYKPILAIIKNNHFNLSGSGTGISCINNVDVQVRNNIFKGTCNEGIYANGQEVSIYDFFYNLLASGTGEAKNVLILGNNFTGLNAAMADIVLGERSSNCTVVGNGKESVIDDGTNNKIVGMKKKPGGHHIGPSIRDNFRMWHRRHH